MKPSSDLNAILRHGHTFQHKLSHGMQDVRITTRQIGELTLTSGRLLACDLLTIPDERYFFKKSLAPGRYPVIISVADFQPVGDARVACAMLRFSETETVAWEAAAINDPNPAAEGDRYAYGVDTGTGSFMDLDAAEVVGELEAEDSDKFEEFCDRVVAEMDKNWLGKFHAVNWADVRLGGADAANIITFSSGWGDGGYASFWGYDVSGSLTCLVTDFALFEH